MHSVLKLWRQTRYSGEADSTSARTSQMAEKYHHQLSRFTQQAADDPAGGSSGKRNRMHPDWRRAGRGPDRHTGQQQASGYELPDRHDIDSLVRHPGPATSAAARMVMAPPYRKSATEWTEATTGSFHEGIPRLGLDLRRKVGDRTNPDVVSAPLNPVVEHDNADMPQDAEERQESNRSETDVFHSFATDVFYPPHRLPKAFRYARRKSWRTRPARRSRRCCSASALPAGRGSGRTPV